jgi:hypothetical protein
MNSELLLLYNISPHKFVPKNLKAINSMPFYTKLFQFSCVLLLSISLQAQSDKKVRLIITDNISGSIHKIDTILPPYSDVEAVLLQLGYDSKSVAEAYMNNQERRITVKTEELIDDDFWARKRAEQQRQLQQNAKIPTTIPNNTTAKTTQSSKITTTTPSPNYNKPNPSDSNGIPLVDGETLHIPPGSKIEETPEGKLITTTRTDADGTVYTETILIGKVKTETKHSQPSMQWNDKMGIEKAPKPLIIGEQPPLDESKIPPKKEQIYHAPPKNISTQQGNTIETFEQNDQYGNKESVKIILGELDLFDHSSIQKDRPELLNYQPLAIQKFAIIPDFMQGYFRFSFETPDENTYNLSIYDVLGTRIHTETLIGKLYTNLIKGLHVYKKGTFLVLISGNNKKFTQKITIE